VRALFPLENQVWSPLWRGRLPPETGSGYRAPGVAGCARDGEESHEASGHALSVPAGSAPGVSLRWAGPEPALPEDTAQIPGGQGMQADGCSRFPKVAATR